MTERLPDVIFVPDAGALARVAADRILARLPGSDGILAVCLAGGSTPERLFQILTTEPWRDAMPWNRVRWFWGDVRFVSCGHLRDLPDGETIPPDSGPPPQP